MKGTFQYWFFAAFTLMLSVSAFGQSTESTVMAKVNGEPVYKESVNLISSNIESSEKMTADEILEELISLRLLSQAAKDINLDKHARIALAIDLQIDQTLANAYTAYVTNGIKVSNEELKSEYERHVSRLEKTEFRVSHIQFDTEQDASNALVELANGVDYIALAKTSSVSPDGVSGGDLGWHSYGSASFERSVDVEKLDVDELSAPLETAFGWHIFKLTDTRGAVIPTFDSIKETLKNIIVRTKFKKHLDSLRDKADVALIDQ